jgi:hypothetical protein
MLLVLHLVGVREFFAQNWDCVFSSFQSDAFDFYIGRLHNLSWFCLDSISALGFHHRIVLLVLAERSYKMHTRSIRAQNDEKSENTMPSSMSEQSMI